MKKLSKVLQVLSILLVGTQAYAGPVIYVTGKGGVVVEDGKKTICPKPSPYVCATIRAVEFQDPMALSIGDIIEVTTLEGDQYNGTLVEISGDGACPACISFE